MASIQEQKETILFVDDEESIRNISEEYFKMRGYGVFTAQNGREAIDIVRNHRIDCCFTDLYMPEMDGLALVDELNTIDNTLPVIIMTGYPSLDLTIRTMKNGVVDFLIKPINLKQMELSVRRVLRQRELFTQNLILTREIEGKKRLEQINSELVHKVDELNTLNRIMSDFGSINSSSDVLYRLSHLAVELTGADEAHLYLISEDEKSVVDIASSFGSTVKKEGHGTGEITMGEDLTHLIIGVQQDEKPVLITENSGQLHLSPKVRSTLLVPLIIRERVFGVLGLFTTGGIVRFSERDLYYISFMNLKAAYSLENLALYENIYENLFSTLYAFVRATEARDPYTQQHSNRVTKIAIGICQEMGLSHEDQEILNVAGRLHDIGKIGIPDEILLKKGKLTAEEYRIIKEHPTIGAEIIARLGLWDREKMIIASHHERFDGKGYPLGLKGEKIPLLARILSVSDVYDAIASDRSYRKRMDEPEILKIMSGGSGTQFDPDIVKVFMTLYNEKRIGAVEVPSLVPPNR